MVASIDARRGSPDVELGSLARDLAQCGMSRSAAVDQAVRELTVLDVVAEVEALRADLEQRLPLAPRALPEQLRRRRSRRIRTGLALLAVAAVWPAVRLADGVVAVFVWAFGAGMVALGAGVVRLLLSDHHRDVDPALPTRPELLADHLARLRDAERRLEACRPVLLSPLDRHLRDVRREIAARAPRR